jgi:hypothetical protein
MSELPQIYADFQNADANGRIRLNCVGTVNDLARLSLPLSEGLRVLLYSDDVDDAGNSGQLVAEGAVTFSPDEHCWVAQIDWTRIQQRPVHDMSVQRGPAPSAVLPPTIDPSGIPPAPTA